MPFSYMDITPSFSSGPDFGCSCETPLIRGPDLDQVSPPAACRRTWNQSATWRLAGCAATRCPEDEMVQKILVLIRGNLVRKLSSYPRLSMASCLTIMATTSSSQSCQLYHYQVVGKCEQSGTRAFTLEKSLGRIFGWRGCVARSGEVIDKMSTRQ